MKSTMYSCRVVALFICLSLAVLVSRTDAQCEFYNGQCVYGKQEYNLYEMWDTDDCETCFCLDEFGYMCCSKFDVPTVYDESCQVFKDKATCQTLVLDKDGNECETFVGIL